ncbi:MAG TPA: MFS transporter [Abditibacteriaceae bacterium]|jgi:MFS family permease
MLKKLQELFDRDRPASAATDEGTLHEKRDPYRALRSRNYRLWATGGLVSAVGGQMFSVAIGWELYERTHDAWALGLVGLVQAAPVILLALPAGHLADRVDRRRIVLSMQAVTFVLWLAIAACSYYTAPLAAFYGLLLLEAVAGAVAGPARSAIVPQLVPTEDLANAVAWNSSRWQTASTIGPAIGGAAIAIFNTAWPVYLIAAVTALAFTTSVYLVRPRPFERPETDEGAWQSLVAGAKFVRAQKIILATLTLDMFAVLFGGATALLPVYAKDILHTGPQGLGWLRAAPAVGALAMGLFLAHRAPMKHAGRALLWAVAGFGAATIVFGISRNFYLSLLMLALTGALDNISVVVRHTLVQVLTPAHMQGRVSAVNSVFIGSSNELGAFESGAAARAFGPIAAVVSGGVATILVVLGVAAAWPQVMKLGSLDDAAKESAAREEALKEAQK